MKAGSSAMKDGSGPAFFVEKYFFASRHLFFSLDFAILPKLKVSLRKERGKLH